MAIKNNNIRTYLNFYANKDQHANPFSEDEFNDILLIKSIELFEEEISNYERTQKITDSLKIFKTENYALTVNSSGVATLPSNYAHGAILGHRLTKNTLKNAAATNIGGGLVGIPCTDHGYSAGDWVVLNGTTNYDGRYIIQTVPDDNTFSITATYVVETFIGTETAAGGDYVSIDIVTDKEWSERRECSVTGPSDTYPIAKIIGSSIYIDPLVSTTVEMEYIRYPLSPRYDYYYDANDEIIYLQAQQTLDAAAAVNAGGGDTRFPCTDHGYSVSDRVTLAGTTNYDGSYLITAVNDVNTFDCTVAYVAETFDGTETITESRILAASEVGSQGQTSTTVTSLSVELEWNDSDKKRIISRILQGIGISLKSQDIVAGAQLEKTEEAKL